MVIFLLFLGLNFLKYLKYLHFVLLFALSQRSESTSRTWKDFCYKAISLRVSILSAFVNYKFKLKKYTQLFWLLESLLSLWMFKEFVLYSYKLFVLILLFVHLLCLALSFWSPGSASSFKGGARNRNGYLSLINSFNLCCRELVTQRARIEFSI